MRWFADLRIAYKIAIVPVVLCVLLIILGVVSSLSLRNIADRAEVVTRDLGPSIERVAQVSDNMARLQLSVSQYARSGEPGAESLIAELDRSLGAALQEAESRLNDAEQQRLLASIQQLHVQYSGLFRERLVPLSQQRQALISGELSEHGPAIDQALSAVLTNAQQSFNLDAVFYASAAMRHLLLGSQYLYQFLQENQDAQVTAFTRELDNAQSMIGVLRDRSSSERLIEQLTQALEVRRHRGAQIGLHVERHQVLELPVDRMEILAVRVCGDVMRAVRPFVQCVTHVGHYTSSVSSSRSIASPASAHAPHRAARSRWRGHRCVPGTGSCCRFQDGCAPPDARDRGNAPSSPDAPLRVWRP